MDDDSGKSRGSARDQMLRSVSQCATKTVYSAIRYNAA